MRDSLTRIGPCGDIDQVERSLVQGRLRHREVVVDVMDEGLRSAQDRSAVTVLMPTGEFLTTGTATDDLRTALTSALI